MHHLADNGAGWQICLYQSWDPERVDRSRRPVLIVPGYGMNSYIFSYHPNGASLEAHLAEHGFEVWRVDLRSQGAAIKGTGTLQFTLEDLALVDLKVAIDAVLAHTISEGDKVDLIGASLGGTLMFTHVTLNEAHKAGALVAIGSPVRWIDLHPLIRMLFLSPTLVGQLRISGTRRMAELALPQIVRFVPWLLKIYLNPDITDTSAARQLMKTVEDPNRFINKQIAEWVRRKDLVVSGVNIGEALRRVENPVLCVLAASDGIVPRATAEFAYHQVASASKKLLVVGDDTLHVAHADLFISNAAHEHVFSPMSAWLAEQRIL
ncbi:MAG: alpha/beta fold hydrolase [Deltaproteobacteria bacterium]|nr:alpha/beta fold hydrolase [Deltaproteobacteria bacterium]